MAKRKGRLAYSRKQKWEDFLLSPLTLAVISELSANDLATPTPRFECFLNNASNAFGKSLNNPSELFDALQASNICCAHTPGDDNEVFAAICGLQNCWKEYKHRASYTHWRKRWHIHQLGLDLATYHALPLIAKTPSAASCPFNMKFIERSTKDGITRYRDLFDTPFAANDSNGYVVDENHGYYVIPPSESVLLYSRNAQGEPRIELVVIRDVTKSSMIASELYRWMESVVDSACRECRNVRPNHPGCMTQVGLNLGPRHARILGWAKSFVRNLTKKARIERDTDVVGAVSITWSIIRSVMPQEILTEVDNALEKDGLPRLATRDVNEDKGFHVRIKGTEYHFPTAERAPPEAYLAVGYQSWMHTDPAFCNWAFASCVSQTAKANGGKRKRPAKSNTKQCSTPDASNYGENFVDASLRVVVQQAARTIIAFKPEHLHGTTRTQGFSNSIISINFSKRVSEAWAKASELTKVLIIAGDGAGVYSSTADL